MALRASDWQMAVELMAEMPSKQVMADKVIFGAAVSACGENLPLALRPRRDGLEMARMAI